MKNIIEQIKKENIGKLEENISLDKYTTYKVGGNARLIVYPKNVEKLICLLKIIRENNINYKTFPIM